jgi:UDP-N-acetyl-D-glucosamine/UDP-N-acetyl-D-galactosamine dehydrogenase
MLAHEDLKSHKEKICIVGLGYVGLPLAVALSKRFKVVGFDLKQGRIAELKNGFDRTREIGAEGLKSSGIEFSSDPSVIRECGFIIIAVPTPIKEGNLPDLALLESAARMVGENLTAGSIIVLESTVYPGVTEDICQPTMEKASGLQAGIDFKIGYSPERINPGDKEHTIHTVTKVVSGLDQESLDVISAVYGSITKIHQARSIKVAEAAKVIENIQRDLNIALMNELSLIFNRMDISIYDVLAASNTKWNFLNFVPGLVGGHCIGVDPYYLTYKAQVLGYQPEVILAGRRINDLMPRYIVETIIKKMVCLKKNIYNSNILLCGITFKEDVPDSRNSKAADIYAEFTALGLNPTVFDPLAYADEVEHEYQIKLAEQSSLPKADVMIIATAHQVFKEMFSNGIENFLNPGAIVFDVKHILDSTKINENYNYLTL